MRQALTISQGQWSTFVVRPISATLLAIAVMLLLAQPLYQGWKNRQAPTGPEDGSPTA
jgi:putative tricarboxylic transport membrane protein